MTIGSRSIAAITTPALYAALRSFFACLSSTPFDLELDDSYLRDDSYDNEICFDDMKINVKEYEGNRVKVPKVVE